MIDSDPDQTDADNWDPTMMDSEPRHEPHQIGSGASQYV